MISKSRILLPLALIIVGQSMFAQSSGFQKLDDGQKNGRQDSRRISVILSTNSRRCVISMNGIWQLVWKW